MDDAKLLVRCIPSIINDEFAFVISFFAHIKHSSRALRLDLEVSKLLLALLSTGTLHSNNISLMNINK